MSRLFDTTGETTSVPHSWGHPADRDWPARVDVEGMRAVLSQFALRASLTLGDDTLERVCSDAMNSAGPGGALSLTLSRWAAADRKPLVLADRRDRRAGGRHPAVGAAAVAQRLRPASGRLSAQHHPVRGGVGADEQAWSTEDVAYVCDLGLVAQDAAGTPRIANPIYAEVVPRHLKLRGAGAKLRRNTVPRRRPLRLVDQFPLVALGQRRSVRSPGARREHAGARGARIATCAVVAGVIRSGSDA